MVEVTRGEDALNARTEAESFLRGRYRLACQAVVARADRDVAFAPPHRRPRILAAPDRGAPRAFDPLVTRRGEEVLYDGAPIDRYRGRILGLAVDLGTTTVVLDFVDLESGRSVHGAAFENPQAFGGSDVMHRISYDREDATGALQKAAASAINRAIVEACARLDVGRNALYEIVVAGNPTMRDVLFKRDVQGIGQRPYKSLVEKAFLAGERADTALRAKAWRLGLRSNPQARAYGLPLIASHVGGDTAAGLAALEEAFAGAETAMPVDMGTNTEVVLKHRGGCSPRPAPPGRPSRVGWCARNAGLRRRHRSGTARRRRRGRVGNHRRRRAGGALRLRPDRPAGGVAAHRAAHDQGCVHGGPQAVRDRGRAGARHHLLQGGHEQSRPSQGRELRLPVQAHAVRPRAAGRARVTTAAAPPFVAIGENIHATRVVLRKGRRVAVRAGAVAVLYRAADGAERALPVPEAAKKTKDYEEGRVKHVQIAIETAMETGDPAEGRRYIEALVRHQERAGAAFLDLNVDEMSPKLEVQTAAMAWLARTVQGMTDLPLSIDSSSIDVIRAGLEALAPGGARAMLNSASLERLDALALARAHDCRVVVTAAGEKGMPDGAEARVANAARMIEAAGGAGFAEGDVYVDPLVFPVSVDGRYGRHCLDAIRALRAAFGAAVHITGGISNVSFGLPARRLLNEAFALLAVEAGADGGIMDPVASPPAALFARDRPAPRHRLAEDVILGRDEHCMAWIRAWRKGELAVG